MNSDDGGDDGIGLMEWLVILVVAGIGWWLVWAIVKFWTTTR